MVIAYVFESRAGMFTIRWRGDGRWCVWFMDKALDNYHSAAAALDDLVGGHGIWPSCGDPSLLDLPEELSEWATTLG
jgi:hypothetical protein